MSELRFYIDECVQPAVAEQLVFHGIDAVSAHSLGQLGDKDVNHLKRATEMGRVLCTHDPDFLELAKALVDHAGIAFAPQYGATVGGMVRALRELHTRMSAEAIAGQVVFLSLK